jgi:hypothetical protein
MGDADAENEFGLDGIDGDVKYLRCCAVCFTGKHERTQNEEVKSVLTNVDTREVVSKKI